MNSPVHTPAPPVPEQPRQPADKPSDTGHPVRVAPRAPVRAITRSMYTYTPQGNGEDGASPPGTRASRVILPNEGWWVGTSVTRGHIHLDAAVSGTSSGRGAGNLTGSAPPFPPPLYAYPAASLAGQEATAAVLQRMFHRSVSSSAEPTGTSVTSPTPLGFGTGVARPMALEQPPASPPTDFSMLGTLAAPMTMASITELSRQVDELSVREPRSEPGAGDFGELPTSPFSMERDARRERHSWTSDGTPAVDARRMRDMQHASANLKERPSPARSTYNGYGEDSYHGAVHDSEGLLDSFKRSYERGYGHITPLEDARRLPFPHSPAYANPQYYDCNGYVRTGCVEEWRPRRALHPALRAIPSLPYSLPPLRLPPPP